LPSAAASSPAGETYTVEAGDTLFEIARRFDTTIDELQRLNRLPSADLIEVGQVLSLP
jgi:LysM repeat protein